MLADAADGARAQRAADGRAGGWSVGRSVGRGTGGRFVRSGGRRSGFRRFRRRAIFVKFS